MSEEIMCEEVILTIYPDDFEKNEQRQYTVKKVEFTETQWGKRADITLEGEQGIKYKVSSWNIIPIGAAFKINVELEGKQLLLQQHSEKKLKAKPF